MLAEKGLSFELITENVWERRKAFAKLNPAMQVPVLIESDRFIMPESYAICEYLEEKYPEVRFLGTNLEENAEVRRLISWFDNKFYNEVVKYLLNEKVIRYLTGRGEPCSSAIRAGKTNILPHMEYIKYLVRNYKWLTGERLTLADISASAHISVLDFLGEVPWKDYPEVKEWYAQIKSRPSFRQLLSDRVIGYAPPEYYVDLDF